jgi:hypothetical protein
MPIRRAVAPSLIAIDGRETEHTRTGIEEGHPIVAAHPYTGSNLPIGASRAAVRSTSIGRTDEVDGSR